MGLGKTLTMIALITADYDSKFGDFESLQKIEKAYQPVQATLIIVPQPCKLQNMSPFRISSSSHLTERC